jgi:hypothetical protein
LELWYAIAGSVGLLELIQPSLCCFYCGLLLALDVMQTLAEFNGIRDPKINLSQAC